MSELNANSLNPDQTSRSAASDLGLYCLPMSLLWDARLKLVNIQSVLNITTVVPEQIVDTNETTQKGLHCLPFLR